MLKLVKNIDNILSAHRRRVDRTEAVLECNGRKYFLVGTARVAIDPSITCVELLTRDSTPRRHVVASDAQDKFEQAARNLIAGGKFFYTCLRGTWNLPAYKWELQK